MSTAQKLGRYLKDLEAEGFTREEALDLVGHAAPMDPADLDTTTAPEGRPLHVVVLAGSREESQRWIARHGGKLPAAYMPLAGNGSALLGLSGPLAVVTLPGFYRLPADQREEIETVISRANAMV